MVLKSKVQDEIVYEIEVSYTSELDFHNIDGVKLLEKRGFRWKSLFEVLFNRGKFNK